MQAGYDDPLRGRLRLGAPDSFGLTCMPSLWPRSESNIPELNVALTIDNSSVLSQRLNDRELDIAILADPEMGRMSARNCSARIECAWVASARLRLPRGAVRPRDLRRHEIFTNPEPSNLMTLRARLVLHRRARGPHLSTCNTFR